MSNSLFQDAATSALLRCVNNGNKARYSGDGRALRECIYDLEHATTTTGWTGRPAGRADLWMKITYDKNDEWGLTEDYIFECKSGVDDLLSGYGLNFSGDRNFLVIPDPDESGKYRSCPWKITPEKAMKHLAEIGRPDVGVLVLKGDKIICVKESWVHNESIGYLFQVAFGDEVVLL